MDQYYYITRRASELNQTIVSISPKAVTNRRCFLYLFKPQKNITIFMYINKKKERKKKKTAFSFSFSLYFYFACGRFLNHTYVASGPLLFILQNWLSWAPQLRWKQSLHPRLLIGRCIVIADIFIFIFGKYIIIINAITTLGYVFELKILQRDF